MTTAMRVCLALGVGLLAVAGFTSTAVGQRPSPALDEACIATTGCMTHNCPSCYCNLTVNNSYKICQTTIQDSKCTNGAATTYTTCPGTTLTGALCSVDFYDCT